jgi:NNP family nitrate/nitrite transporter-like MFS transporter
MSKKNGISENASSVLLDGMNRTEANKALILSTLAFALSFAVWGLIAPMARTFQSEFHLTEGQVWLVIAVPVLLGSVMRLPMGMLADRLGGRIVFGLLLLFIGLPAAFLSFAHTYGGLLAGGLLLGMAGTSFSIGAALVSRWFPPERQGLALGIYGLGTGGQSLALMGVPVLAAQTGWQVTYRLFAAAAVLWGIVFLLFARDAPGEVKPKRAGEMLGVLRRQPLAWLLGLFYFVTFGGFVALSIGLPKLLQEIFHLTREDAGLRVAGFAFLATMMRPLGGWLGDRVGGARVLLFAFGGAAVLAVGLTSTSMVWFTVGALGVAAWIGLGNGAVFKLVPQYFPKDTGTVTGLVGALGGLGGFFPPLLLGIIKTYTGSYTLAFLLLSLFCVACLWLSRRYFLSPGQGDASGRWRVSWPFEGRNRCANG